MMNVKELVNKVKEFTVKNKYYVAGGAVALLFMGGVGLALSQPKVAKNNVAVSTTTTKVTKKSESTTKSSEVVVAESKIEALLSAEPSASTDVASIEKEIANVKDEAVKAQLTQKLATVKQEVVRKQQEQPQVQQSQQVAQAQQVQKQDETSQKVTPTPQQPTPQTQAPVQTQRQTQAPAPVQTTQRVTRTPETTQATTRRHIVMGGMGNSGREFSDHDSADNWAWNHELYKSGKKGYDVLPIVYSDGTTTYTVEWGD